MGSIERLDRAELETRLRRVARELFPDLLVDDLELQHLIRVVTECSLLLTDVYSDDRLAQIMRPDRPLPASLLDRLIESPRAEEEEVLARVRRLPEDVRMVGDKALFDLGLLGLQQVKGFDLEELGARAYKSAGQVLELLAEDRRLRRFFKQNRLLMLPLEEEVVFLRQCSEKIRIYADILKHTHAQAGPAADGSLAAAASRVTLMAAAAEALAEEFPAEVQPDVYLRAARGQSAPPAEPPKERVLSDYERILLFSALDMPRLQAALEATVVDQQSAIRALCDEFSLFAAGTRDPRKPPAYFLVGPTGVGKNHLVETLSRMLEGIWRIEVPLLTIEGPNYTYPSDINELRGATRGFIRSDEEGLLTSFHARSTRAPLGVILVDEVEKAHPHLLTFFLSILDRGTTTDNRGEILDFSNCMIFFTSNLGYSEAQRGTSPIGYMDETGRHRASDRDVRQSLRHSLPPEFVSRVRMVHFNRLSQVSAERILDLELERIGRRYQELHGLSIELDPSARAELLRRGFSESFGARHLASTLDSTCNVEIARKLQQEGRRGGDDRTTSLIAWLREIRAGQRPYEAEKVRERVWSTTRARLKYDRLRIVFREGRFEFLPRRSSRGR